ncbi:MAG TPA: chromosomal replication initiator protein DnaA [Armatimonadota bacterium]|nr:chromosomal replication initiator protein DnaA [Armatimonadota bacterium]HOM83984.1 chromosomal replication initiator protein DnaA [Armatimonadota bacterium]HPO71384.1 chromosomal replication initiator protein DnaA [Armatimonadota bacterium]
MTKQLHIDGLFASAEELWESVLAALRRLPDKRLQDECLQGSRAVRLEDGTLAVEVTNRYSPDFVEKRCRRAVEEILERLVGSTLPLCFRAGAEAPEEADTPPETRRPAPAPKPASSAGQRLNIKYRFDTFAVGQSNTLAWRAAMAVANAPASTYNPLLLCGGVGVGKTHLLQAIGHEIARLFPSQHVVYVTADAFTYEFVTALRERRTDAFRKRYRGADVLLVDDLQFLAGKESTEEEFFLTFTAVQEAGKQIVCCSDRCPREMPLLPDRLRSRLESGLIVEIGAPDFETRVQILRRKAEAEGIEIDEEVLLFVANLIESDVRALEGALIKLIACSSLTRRPLTCALAEETLVSYVGRKSSSSVTVETVLRATCDFYRVDAKAVKSKRRDKSVVLPRQVAMYLSRQITNAPLAEIGERFGGRDHSTVIAACNKIKGSLESDTELRAAIEEISRRLAG